MDAPSPLENKLSLDSTTLERFLSKIDKNGPNGCWIWTAFRNEHGYGKFRFGPQGSSPLRAHRLSYELAIGKIPDGYHLHHACNNRACVNPAHLEPVTPRDHAVEKTLNSASSICAHKTHCKNGHEFTPENTIKTSYGKRVCRICISVWRHKKYRKTHPEQGLKTHCVKGHPLSGDNLYIYKSRTGIGRGCRICRRATVDTYSQKNSMIVKAKGRVRNKVVSGNLEFSALERDALALMAKRSEVYASVLNSLP